LVGGLSHLPGGFARSHQQNAAGEGLVPDGTPYRLIREDSVDGLFDDLVGVGPHG
jgi:hypothetical protein